MSFGFSVGLPVNGIFFPLGAWVGEAFDVADGVVVGVEVAEVEVDEVWVSVSSAAEGGHGEPTAVVVVAVGVVVAVSVADVAG